MGVQLGKTKHLTRGGDGILTKIISKKRRKRSIQLLFEIIAPNKIAKKSQATLFDCAVSLGIPFETDALWGS